MGRLDLAALLVLAAACGGDAQRDRTTNASGGAGSDSGGAPSSGGSAIVSGGTSASAGSVAAGGTSPVGAAGTASALSVDCDNGSATYVSTSAPAEPAPGFVGMFDGAALMLSAVPVREYTADPGTIHAVLISCEAAMLTNINLRFDEPHEGDELSILVNRTDTCVISATYSGVVAEIDLEIKTWVPDYLPGGEDVFLYGEFTATVPSLNHVISGQFAIPADHEFCLI